MFVFPHTLEDSALILVLSVGNFMPRTKDLCRKAESTKSYQGFSVLSRQYAEHNTAQCQAFQESRVPDVCQVQTDLTAEPARGAFGWPIPLSLVEHFQTKNGTADIRDSISKHLTSIVPNQMLPQPLRRLRTIQITLMLRPQLPHPPFLRHQIKLVTRLQQPQHFARPR